MCVCVYIDRYIDREKDRERERKRERYVDLDIPTRAAPDLARPLQIRACSTDSRVWPLHVGWHVLSAAALY